MSAVVETPAKRVAYLGLGRMGGPMARHLVTAGHDVRGWNRGDARGAAWGVQVPQGYLARSIEDAVADAAFIMLCVSDDGALREVMDRAFAIAIPGAIFIDHSTVSASISEALAAEASLRDFVFLDAPVSGGQAGAENGTLSVMVGGEEAAFAAALPLLRSYGRTVVRVGGSGAGQRAKMVNQIAIAGLIQALAEALAFGRKAGLDMQAVLDVIGGGAAQSWQMHNRAHTMLAGRFDFGFALDLMRKDLGLVAAEAEHIHADLPVTQLIAHYYDELAGEGYGGDDTSALIRRLS